MEHHGIKSNIMQSIFSQKFLIAVMVFVVMVFFSRIEVVIGVFRNGELLASNFCNQFILQALKSHGVILCLPIVCALPYTVSFVEDLQSGFIKSYIHRINVKEYLVGKIVACTFSGGLALVVGILISYGLTIFMFSPFQAVPVPDKVVTPFIQPFTITILLFFCSGALWSMVGMAAATATNSKYMAYASPFMVYYLLIILKERYFDGMSVLYPKQWIQPGQGWLWGDFGVILLLLELIVATSIMFVIATRRRLKNI